MRMDRRWTHRHTQTDTDIDTQTHTHATFIYQAETDHRLIDHLC